MKRLKNYNGPYHHLKQKAVSTVCMVVRKAVLLDWQARDSGTADGRWLMVNVQNVQEFACQALNRDVWSNSAVKAIIKQHFVFWQVSVTLHPP